MSWVRDRLTTPEPHLVYVLQLASVPVRFYVGVTLVREFAARMAAHGRSARRLLNAPLARRVDERDALASND